MATYIFVEIGLGNGLSVGTNTLPEPMLTYNQQGSVAFHWAQFHCNYSRYNSITRVRMLHFLNYCHIFHDPHITKMGWDVYLYHESLSTWFSLWCLSRGWTTCFLYCGYLWGFYPRPFWPTGIVIACVCVCVCLSVCVSTFACPDDNSSSVQARFT